MTFRLTTDTSVPTVVLVVRHPGDLRGMRLPVGPKGAVLGRDGDLVVPSPTVSRRHARTWWHDGALWIEDCGSSNGTLVNGEQVHAPVQLEPGDTVTIGGVECDVVSSAEDIQPDHREPAARDTAWPTQPLPDEQTETTRYLCAATHLDASFCDQVIRHTLGQPYRAVAPSFGVDVAAVATHALAARSRRLIRDMLLLALLVGALIVWSTRLVTAGRVEALRRMDGGTVHVLVSALWPTVLVFVGVAVLIGAVEAWITRYLVLTKQLSTRKYRPLAIRQPSGRRARERLARIAAATRGNLVVFRGFHPFVGAGTLVTTWSFAVDISKGRPTDDAEGRRVPKPFQAVDLHDHLVSVLRKLDLPGLEVTNRLFVNGRDVWQDARLLRNRTAGPVSSVPDAMIRTMLDDSASPARVYLCATATGWHGQLVVTTFFRAVKLRGSLYLEGSSYELLPLHKRFFAVDSVAPRGSAEAAMASASHAAARLVPLVFGSPVRIVRTLIAMASASSTGRRQRRFIEEGWSFDYGAASGIREIAAGSRARRHFLETDGDMFVKSAREMLLRGIVEFLAEHDIDTGPAANFQQVINNGHVFNGYVDNRNSNAFNSGSIGKSNTQPRDNR